MPKSTTWLSQADAGKYLGVTDRTIRRYIADGRLPAYRVGPRTIRIKVDDLDALLTLIPSAAS